MTASAPPTDEELLLAYAGGDAQAARTLTARLAPRVLAQASRMLGPGAEAEDITQEAMLRLWVQARGWRPGAAQPATWLYRVTANLCIDRLRKTRRLAPLDEADHPADEAPSAAERLHSRARAEALRAAIARLPKRQAQAVALRHLEGLSNEEIARVLSISPRAAESLTARGKRALAKALAPRKADLGIL